MKKHIKDIFTIIGITSIIIISSSLAYAFVGPTAVPPGNNVSGPINTSSNPQSKGRSITPPGSLLNIAGTFSSNLLYVIQNMTVQNEVKVSALTTNQGVWTSGVRPVCIDSANKLVICDAICGNLYVEKAEQCDDGNTTSGDGCSNSCLIE